MNIHHIPKNYENFFAKYAITKVVYGSAHFVPIAVPRNFKSWLIKIKNAFFSLISANSIRVSLEICLLSLNSKTLQREFKPSLFGMLG